MVPFHLPAFFAFNISHFTFSSFSKISPIEKSLHLISHFTKLSSLPTFPTHINSTFPLVATHSTLDHSFPPPQNWQTSPPLSLSSIFSLHFPPKNSILCPLSIFSFPLQHLELALPLLLLAVSILPDILLPSPLLQMSFSFRLAVEIRMSVLPLLLLQMSSFSLTF